jgi:hypothetical protein
VRFPLPIPWSALVHLLGRALRRYTLRYRVAAIAYSYLLVSCAVPGRPPVRHRSCSYGRDKTTPAGTNGWPQLQVVARRSVCWIRAGLWVMVPVRRRSFVSVSRLLDGIVVSVQPVPWPDPDRQVAAAMRLFRGSHHRREPGTHTTFGSELRRRL